MDNYKQYYKYIYSKFDISNKKYKKIYTKPEKVNSFLMTYENMNVYPVYPTAIILPIETNIKYEFYKDGEIVVEDKYKKLLDDKINEFMAYDKEIKEAKSDDKIRRFFDYEIRDEIKKHVGESYVTNAWIKMYELLVTFDLIGNKKEINTFHICEHPGAFIYATQDFIQKNYPNSKHDFIFQSLKPYDDPQIFKTEYKLLKRFSNKLDYGKTGTGDITNINNILYYGDKYRNKYFDLVTSDCGLACEDFTQQESELYKIYFGALLCSLLICKDKSNYVAKFFSFNNYKTIEIIYIASLFFDKVYITRILTTKSFSGENYMVCMNYKENDKLLSKIIDYYKNYDKQYLLFDINQNFLKKLSDYSELLSMRRIVSINSLIFRLLNIKYVNNNPELKKYVIEFTKYYVNYFIKYINIIDESNK